jgi:glycosyltransferase involved in cell wall biosynthesis
MRIAILGNPDNVHVQRWVRFLNGRGHEILVIADPHTNTRVEGVKTVTPKWNLATNILAFRLTPRPHGNSLWKFIHYRPLIRDFRPDVVHGFEAYYNGLATAWAGPYPRVLTPWGFDVHRDGLRGGLWTWIVKKALRGVDRISTNDDTMPNFLAERYGVNSGRVIPFSWGVDLSVFRPGLSAEAAALQQKLKIPSDAPVILSPRNFDPDWGAETVIESIPHLLATIPNAIFIILAATGPADFRSRMKSRAEEFGVANSIRWIEQWLSPPEMAALFNLARVFISVPKTDLMAMTIIEGMACGCVPILAPITTYRKHARDLENAVVLQEATPQALAAGLATALGNETLLTSASAACAARMREQEDEKINMAKVEVVYEEAIHSFAPPRRRGSA